VIGVTPIPALDVRDRPLVAFPSLSVITVRPTTPMRHLDELARTFSCIPRGTRSCRSVSQRPNGGRHRHHCRLRGSQRCDDHQRPPRPPPRQRLGAHCHRSAGQHLRWFQLPTRPAWLSPSAAVPRRPAGRCCLCAAPDALSPAAFVIRACQAETARPLTRLDDTTKDALIGAVARPRQGRWVRNRHGYGSRAWGRGPNPRGPRPVRECAICAGVVGCGRVLVGRFDDALVLDGLRAIGRIGHRGVIVAVVPLPSAA
jgi:hypothetical protein